MTIAAAPQGNTAEVPTAAAQHPAIDTRLMLMLSHGKRRVPWVARAVATARALRRDSLAAVSVISEEKERKMAS